MSKVMPRQKRGESKQDYQTPSEFLRAAARKLGIAEGFSFDLAAAEGAHIAWEYFDKATDALIQDWPKGGWNWLNPPYDDIAPWVKKAYMQGCLGSHTAVLIPASSGANWWKLWVDGKCRVLQLNGRITFVGESDPYPKDCALLLYGPDIEPGYEVWSWGDLLTEDEKQMAKQAQKRAKAAKPPKSDNVREFKKRGRKAQSDFQQPIETITAGDLSTLPERIAALDSEILLPAPDDAVRLLGELATLNDQALAAGKVYEELKERTKTAKEKYDELAERVLTRLQVGTHKSDLPLFSLDEREADQRRMEEAALEGHQEVTGAASGGEQAPEGSTDSASSFVAPEPAEQAPEMKEEAHQEPEAVF